MAYTEAAGDASVELKDVNGKTMLVHHQVLVQGSNIIRIKNLSALAGGVYQMILETNGKRYVEKLVKE